MLDEVTIHSNVMDRVRGNARAQGGVWHRSSDQKYFIYCVGQDPIKINAFMKWALHNQIGMKPLVGMYQGVSERSFISNLNDLEAIHEWLEKEESILILGACNSDNEPSASLLYLSTGKEQKRGRLIVVDQKTALAFPSWTYDPLTENYYLCA